ncbi:hypothetical protein CHS0354_015749 [Potamilus streckersoni]|uniref:Cysteine-rich motor neuron 1 protein n=1 Tax=Potamilus streckersoni TaxID=2493646 RepID=A0AAE0T3R6_9BIVA|nr:hypothetical protein CHS0354_015749 [Potamilus streckersoni]
MTTFRQRIPSSFYSVWTNVGILLLVTLFICRKCNAKNICTSIKCPEVTADCSNQVLNSCGCCSVCARGLHERCGGKCDEDGACGDGLECVIHAQPGDKVTGHETGICQKVPGNCADTSSCDSIQSYKCPADSILVYNGTLGEDQCCRNTYTCQCNFSVCKMPHCAAGHIPVLQKSSSGKPGQCCDKYHCKVSGCMSSKGEIYKNFEIWKEGDCMTCLCIEGKKRCTAEMCAKTCHNPRIVPGYCCPVCDEPSYHPLPAHCANMSHCNLTCVNGLWPMANGCYLCKCKPDDCYNYCKFGYLQTDEGAEQCACARPPVVCPPMTHCDKKCKYGFKTARNGCQKCRCNKCPSFTCLHPCPYGYKRDDMGCDTCSCKAATSCVYEGAEVALGTRWQMNNCTECLCSNEGHVLCVPQSCPKLVCPLQVMEPGQCCPICSNTRDLPGSTEESKYIIPLSIAGVVIILLLVLVFVLLYLKLKQRHTAHWTLPPKEEDHCTCPLYSDQSKCSKYTLNSDNSNKYFDSIMMHHPCIEMALESSEKKKKTFLQIAEEKDPQFVCDRECIHVKNDYNLTRDNWSSL